MNLSSSCTRAGLLLVLSGLVPWACTGSDAGRSSGGAGPDAGHQTDKVQAPWEVSWSWDEADGPAPLLVLSLTPHLPVTLWSVEVRGSAGLALTPAGVIRLPQTAARTTVTHEVRCTGQGEGATDGVDVLIQGQFEGLDMGRALRIPLPASIAGEGGLPPSAGELVEDQDGELLRVLPAKIRTGRR